MSNALALSVLGAIPAHATVYKTEPNEEALEAAYRYGFNFGMATSACLGYYQNYSSRKYWLYTVNYIRKNENYRGEYQDIMENFQLKSTEKVVFSRHQQD